MGFRTRSRFVPVTEETPFHKELFRLIRPDPTSQMSTQRVDQMTD